MPDDIKILTDMLEGFETKGKQLRANEALFLEAQGLNKAIERNRGEVETLAEELATSKADLKDLKAKKKAALSKVSETICSKLNEFLPIDNAFFDADEKLSFGWEYQGNKQHYNSLSGGQKAIFDTALENLLGSNIMIIEAAEMDNQHLTAMLEDTAKMGKQVFVNSWFKDVVIPENFELVEV